MSQLLAAGVVGFGLGALMARPKNESKNVQEDINDFIANVSQTYISSHTQTLASTGISSQFMNFTGATWNHCAGTITNYIDANIVLSAKLDDIEKINLSSNILSTLSSNIAAIAGQTTAWWSLFSGGNSAENIQRIVNHVNDNINQTVIMNTYNSVINQYYTNQGFDFTGATFNCDPGEPWAISNITMVKLVATTMSKILTDVMMDGSLEMQALASMKAELQQRAGTAGGGWLKWVLIILAIAVGLGFIVWIIMVTRKQQIQAKPT
jgi:hypothetical protein